ncbi:unnamed protein product, partial [Microthlaspi erraticum]
WLKLLLKELPPGMRRLIILNSQVLSVDSLFFKHPDFAVNVRPKNQLVKTTYMNLLLCLIKTLDKPPHSITDTELSNAHSELIELTGAAGFKLDWLKTKLDAISLERKKENADGSRVRKFEEQIHNLKAELNKEKTKSVTSSAKVLSLEQTVSDLKAELNKEKLESDTHAAKVVSLEQTLSDLKDELNKEKGKSDTYADKVVLLEQTLSDLKDELNNEKGKSDTYADKVVSLEQTLSDLRGKQNKNKNKNKKRKLSRK